MGKAKAEAAEKESAQKTWRGCARIPSDGDAFSYVVCPTETGFRLTAYPGKSSIGPSTEQAGVIRINYAPQSKRYSVGLVRVESRYQGVGLATRLYERALGLACDPNGKRTARALSSDDVRSPFSEAFWRKQERKGRATCIPGPGIYYDRPMQLLQYRLEAGEITKKEYERITSGLPTTKKRGVVYDEEVLLWPCERYEIACANRPKSLAALHRRLRKG